MLRLTLDLQSIAALERAGGRFHLEIGLGG
jgi:hypothetical protein